MNSLSIARVTSPKITNGEIKRTDLVDAVLKSEKKFAYIHAGAGYGKTTILGQIANSRGNSVWLSLAGESDIFTFLNIFSTALQQSFPGYGFTVSEYIPFIGKDNFITIITNAFINSIEKLSDDFIIILDDLHTIKDRQIREFIACFMKYAPENIRLCLSSREALWKEMLPIYVRGKILEIGQDKLSFTREEAVLVLGSDDDAIYSITEGWPLAVGAFRVLLEDGVSLIDAPSRGKEALYSYLFYECVSHLPPEMIDFLKTSACFEELDNQMLDAVLDKKNTKLMLENLVSRNMFTIKTGGGLYRYHALFREGLLETVDDSQKCLLQHKAAQYYWKKKNYFKAAGYAILLNDKGMLQRIIIESYRNLMMDGNYSELRIWFQALEDGFTVSDPEILAAKGAYLSSIGNFTEAKACLDIAIPLLNENNKELFIESMVHKARVLRNYVSFEESDKLLDKLIGRLENHTSETAYDVVIEKLYNLCWNSRVNEAFALAFQMTEDCARAGNLKIKAWFERYLCAVYFFAGRMKECVHFYEKSLKIPESQREYLDMHGIGIYAAKAYQMLGDRDLSLSILGNELRKMRSTGKYEEMWAGYLFAAEIHYENTFIDRVNGQNKSYETTIKYFTLADEYAPLYRKTDLQTRWAKLQSLTYSLIFTNSPKEDIINEIFANVDQAGGYLKSIVYARLMGYFAVISDFQNALKCAKLCIEVGEKTNMLLQSTLAYGILSRAAITTGNKEEAVYYTKRYLQLCHGNGIYDYFRARKAYDVILEFAYRNSIEPEITEQIMGFVGYKIKKAYIKTFGEFAVFPYMNREKSLKIRTRKERELLAALLDSKEQGLTKEQIYEAIWSESESKDIKKLIGVNLSQIKKDLACLGIENSIICRNNHYCICRDEIECDFELFEEAAFKFKMEANKEDALKILNLYTGEYISEFEALWATAKRIKYRKLYEEAVKYCL